jgi:hypothetical protein
MSKFLNGQCPRARIRGWVRRSLARRRASTGDEASKQSETPVNEDVLAKLRQFEEENKKLKEQIESQVRHAIAVLSVIWTKLAYSCMWPWSQSSRLENDILK